MAADAGSDLFRLTPEAEVQRQLRFSKRLLAQRCRRVVERCLDLTPAEITHRLGILLTRRQAPAPAVSAPHAVPSREQMIAALDRSFLVGPRDRERIVAAIGAEPGIRARVLEEGRRLATEGTRIFDRIVQLDPHEIDWRVDPCTGRRLWPEIRMNEADAVRATRAPDGQILTDVKYVWELNRHQFLLPLALAAHLAPDAALLERLALLVDRWIEQNPVGRGVNWSSVLEVGVRAISWLWTLPFVISSPSCDPRRTERWLTSLGDHYEFLRRNLSIYTDRSNHLIGEATALWLLASVVPDLPDATAEAARAMDVLATEIARQVTADGVSREQAVGYHCFVLDFYLQITRVARHQGTDLPAIIESRVTAMLEFLHRLLGAGGELPSIGDGDDGLGLPPPCPLSPRERAESLLTAGARLFERPRWRPAQALSHPLSWGPPRDPEVPPAPPSAVDVEGTGSTLFRDGGYCFLEAVNAKGGARQLILDVGRLGYLPNGAHEHADALSVLVRINETLVVADPGTGTYTASPIIRNSFRATAAHNTITIDDLDQADALDTFKWLNMTATQLLTWQSDPAFDYVEASHTGYQRLRRPVRHVRAVLFVRPEYWIIVDRIEGHGTHRVRRRFHFPPEVRVAAAGPQAYDALDTRTADGLRLTFVDPPGQPVSTTAIEPSPWSRGYGRWEPSTRLSAEVSASPDLTFLTLLTPLVARQSEFEIDCASPTSARPGTAVNETVLCRVRSRMAAEEGVLMVRHHRSAGPDELLFVRRTPGGEVVHPLGTMRGRGR